MLRCPSFFSFLLPQNRSIRTALDSTSKMILFMSLSLFVHFLPPECYLFKCRNTAVLWGFVWFLFTAASQLVELWLSFHRSSINMCYQLRRSGRVSAGRWYLSWVLKCKSVFTCWRRRKGTLEEGIVWAKRDRSNKKCRVSGQPGLGSQACSVFKF